MNGEWAGVVISVTFLLTTGAVILLRPIARRVGEFLEVVIQEKRATQRLEPPGPMQETLEDVVQRVTLLERRLEFAENLIAAPRASGSIPAPAESGRGADVGRARAVGGVQPPEPAG